MRRFVGAVLVVVAACSEPAEPLPDASPDAAPDAPPAPPLPDPPIPPTLPDLLPCPDGWQQTEGAGAGPECEAFPAGEAMLCPSGSFLGAGDSACATIGSECATDGWPVELPSAGTVVFVDAAARGAATGSRDQPFATIAAGVAAAPDGATVAVRAGRYDESLSTSTAVEIVGGCAEGTVIGPSATAFAITVESAVLSLLDLTITSAGGGVDVLPGAGLVMRSSSIDGVAGDGLRARGATVTLTSSVVRDVQNAGGESATALSILEGSSATLTRGGIQGVIGTGIWVGGTDSRVEAEQLVIRDTLVESIPSVANAIRVEEGGTFVGRALAIRRSVGAAILVDAGGSADITDAHIHDVFAGFRDADFEFEEDEGAGVFVWGGGSAVVRRTRVDGHGSVGFLARGEGASISADDVVVRDLVVVADYLAVFGAGASLGGSFDCRRLAILRSHDAALSTFGGTIDCEDVIVRETFDESVASAPSLQVRRGGLLRVRRAEVQSAYGVGALALLEGSLFEATDLSIRDVSSTYNGTFGYGVTIARGATGHLERLRVERARGVGLLVADATAEVSHASFSSTSETACAADTCEGYGLGINVSVLEEGVLSMDHFDSVGPALCGLQLATGASVDLAEGTVRGGPIGVNLQVEGYDVNRLTERVSYSDNGVNLDSSELPVPEIPSGT